MATLAGRIGATREIARQAAGQRRVPYLPDEDRHQLRDARVRAIVRFAGLFRYVEPLCRSQEG